MYNQKQNNEKCNSLCQTYRPNVVELSVAKWPINASPTSAIIGSDNGLSPVRRQATVYTNAVLLSIGLLGTNFSQIVFEIQIFPFKKRHLKMSFGKCRPFFGFNVLKLHVQNWTRIAYRIYQSTEHTPMGLTIQKSILGTNQSNTPNRYQHVNQICVSYHHLYCATRIMGLLPDTWNCGCACAGNIFPATADKRSRHASRHVRDARAVVHAGIAN